MFTKTKTLSTLLLDGNPTDQVLFSNLADSISFPIDLTVTPRTDTATQKITKNNFDLFFINHTLDVGDGIFFYKSLKNQGYTLPPSILVTRNGSEDLAARWFRNGGDAYLSKKNINTSAFEHSITTALKTAVEYKRLEEELLMDPKTGLWRTRYMVEKFESFKNDCSETEKLGAGLVEVTGLSTIRKKQGLKTYRKLLKKLAKNLKKTVAHTGICGHYFENTFWVLFQKAQTNLMNSKLTSVIDNFETLIEHELPEEETRVLAAGIIASIIPDNFSRLQRKLDLLILKASNSPGAGLMMSSM